MPADQLAAERRRARRRAAVQHLLAGATGGLLVLAGQSPELAGQLAPLLSRLFGL